MKAAPFRRAGPRRSALAGRQRCRPGPPLGTRVHSSQGLGVSSRMSVLLPLPGDGQRSVGASGCKVRLAGQAHAALEAPAAPRPPCALPAGPRGWRTPRGRRRAPAARWGGAWGWEGPEEMGQGSGLRASGGREREAPSATARQAANDAAPKPPSPAGQSRGPLAAGSEPRTPPPVCRLQGQLQGPLRASSPPA